MSNGIHDNIKRSTLVQFCMYSAAWQLAIGNPDFQSLILSPGPVDSGDKGGYKVVGVDRPATENQ